MKMTFPSNVVMHPSFVARIKLFELAIIADAHGCTLVVHRPTPSSVERLYMVSSPPASLAPVFEEMKYPRIS